MTTYPLDAVRDAVDLPELIGRYVKLKRTGNRFIGLCPFHREKTPSFGVNRGEQYYKCFGCGASGSCFDFLMHVENLTFQESLKKLAEENGIAKGEGNQPTAAQKALARQIAAESEYFWGYMADHYMRKANELWTFINRGARYMTAVGDDEPDPIAEVCAWVGVTLEEEAEDCQDLAGEIRDMPGHLLLKGYRQLIGEKPKLQSWVRGEMAHCARTAAVIVWLIGEANQ